MFNMIMFGPPGSGKGTQSKLVAEHYNFLHLSTGDLFRKEIENKTALGDIVKAFINRGLLVPDNIVMREFYRYALMHKEASGIVFDGFPRNPSQAANLDKVFHKKELRIALVIFMQVPDNELIKRVLGRALDSGRTDDTIEIMQKRLEVYKTITRPVIDYYKITRRLVEVDGTRHVEVVAKEIRQIVGETMGREEVYD
jgi:adenylate kinase